MCMEINTDVRLKVREVRHLYKHNYRPNCAQTCVLICVSTCAYVYVLQTCIINITRYACIDTRSQKKVAACPGALACNKHADTFIFLHKSVYMSPHKSIHMSIHVSVCMFWQTCGYAFLHTCHCVTRHKHVHMSVHMSIPMRAHDANLCVHARAHVRSDTRVHTHGCAHAYT